MIRFALVAVLVVMLSACANAPRRSSGGSASICHGNPVTCERHPVRPWDVEVWTGNLQP